MSQWNHAVGILGRNEWHPCHRPTSKAYYGPWLILMMTAGPIHVWATVIDLIGILKNCSLKGKKGGRLFPSNFCHFGPIKYLKVFSQELDLT